MASVTLTAFVLSVLFLTRAMSRFAIGTMRVGLAGGAYLLAAGLYLLTGWPDPLASQAAVPQEDSPASDSRLGALALAGFGAYMVYLFAGTLRNARDRQ
jgi:hypothetical protein